MRYDEVFIPGGFPRHTYNPRVDLKLEDRLNGVLANLCKLATITGQTKSGKTVLARKVFPEEKCVWVDGGMISEENDFWQVVLAKLNLFPTTEKQASTEITGTIEAKAKAGANLLVAKGSGELGGSISGSETSGSAKSRTVSPRVAALEGLSKSRVPLVVDDFHYLKRDSQASIVRALKGPIFNGLPVAIIAIPHRRYDALKVEREMTGRIESIEIPPWTEDELQFIPHVGFQHLGVEVPESIMRRFASEAIGSPHLMQDFCRTLCRLVDVDSIPPENRRLAGDTDLSSVFHEVAETIGRPMFEKLARGPRQRKDRLRRHLKDGRTVDIYEMVLHGLAHLRPGLVSLNYEDLRAAIKTISEPPIPQLNEISGVLRQMAIIAAKDESSTPVIDFEETDKKLHVTDPFFAFYLRWGRLSE